MRFPTIRRAINFVAEGSYDRTLFSFAPMWSRTIVSGAISLGMLSLSSVCAFLLRDPLVAGNWAATVPFLDWIVLGTSLSLVTYTVRDFLASYRADIELNAKLAIANHWLSFGEYLMRNSKGQSEQHNFADSLMISSRAFESEQGLHILCLIREGDMPVLVSCRVSNESMVIGKGESNPILIRRMLNVAAGEWHYCAADALGISYEPADSAPAATTTRRRSSAAPAASHLGEAGSLSHLGASSKQAH